MKLRYLWLTALVFGSAGAQTVPYTLSGQIRYRGEVDNRSFIPERKPNQCHLLRSRIGVQIKPEPGVEAFVQIQDSRLFGGENSSQARGTSDATADAVDFHQAYFLLDHLFNKPIRLKIGRQELRYGNERLIGISNWTNTGRAFDAGVLSYGGQVVNLDLFYSRLNGSQTCADTDNLLGIYSVLRFFGPILLDGYIIHDYNTSGVKSGIDQSKDILNRYTIGLNFHGKGQRIQWMLEGYRQFGEMQIKDALPLADIRGSLLSAVLGYMARPESSTCISLSACRVSGDNNANDSSARQFNTLFGSNHSFYGLMDYYPDRLLASYGLQDYAFTTSTNAGARLNLAAEAHFFRTDVVYPSFAGKNLGKELDVTMNWKYTKSVALQAGCAAFFPDTLVRSLRGSAVSSWAFVMTTVNF